MVISALLALLSLFHSSFLMFVLRFLRFSSSALSYREKVSVNSRILATRLHAPDATFFMDVSMVQIALRNGNVNGANGKMFDR